MPQMLPPELMARAHQAALTPPPLHPPLPPPPPPPSSQSQSQPQPQPPHGAAHGIDPTKIQLPCASCKAILNVPHGLARFACPQCGVDLAVDVSKVKQFFPSVPPSVPPEEVNEVRLGYPASIALSNSNTAFSVFFFSFLLNFGIVK